MAKKDDTPPEDSEALKEIALILAAQIPNDKDVRDIIMAKIRAAGAT